MATTISIRRRDMQIEFSVLDVLTGKKIGIAEILEDGATIHIHTSAAFELFSDARVMKLTEVKRPTDGNQ